ncbi:leucine-rich repeat and guanylate kinase domain-containing protein [Anableps anableps]
MEDKLHEQLSVTSSKVCITESLNAAETVNCTEQQEDNEVEVGVLTEEMVSGILSRFGHDLTGQKYILCNLSLPSLNLTDTSVLCNYVHLEKLELPHNKIKDISFLNHMPHLVILDMSHNEISNFFQFQPLQYLQVANFSHNHIPDIKDLAGFFCLRKLDLDYNCLSEIRGLKQCSALTHLSLAYNKITKISNLSNLPITHLCLQHGIVSQSVSQHITVPTQSFQGPARSPSPADSNPVWQDAWQEQAKRRNQLKDVEGLEKLNNLQILDLSMNCITSLSGLKNLHFLCSINLKRNQILEIQDLKEIIGLPLLTDLNLLENPVQEQPDYRLRVIFLHQYITMLDQETVTVKEKVSSVNMFDPPLDLLAAKDQITHIVYQMRQPQVLFQSTLPTADNPYPMLVLTGPEGCWKKELVHRLCQEFDEYFGVGVCHTTRQPFIGEENGIDYHFVSEEDFQNLVEMGKFILTMQYGGYLFGLTRDSIEDVTEQGLVCCVHMELEGVFSLKKSYYNPQYFLLLPARLEEFVNHLESHYLFTPIQIDLVVQRVALYLKTNEQRPRFFDNIIPCDDCEEAYQTLQQVVESYLLVEEEEGKTNNGASSDSSFTGLYSAENLSPLLPESQSVSFPELALDPYKSSFMPCFTNIQAEFNTPKTSIELASMRRREQLAREAVVGKRPGLYSPLFKWYNSDVSPTSSFLSVPSSASGMVEPLHSSMLVQTPEMPKDCNLGLKAKSILPPISPGHKNHEVPKTPESPRINPKPPVKTNKGANVDG